LVGDGGAAGGDEGVDGAADAEDRIPEADVTWLRRGHVDLGDDCAREDVGYREEKVGELGDAAVAGVANADDGLRGVGVGEEGAGARYDAEDFAYDARAGRDVDGRVGAVDALGEEDNFAVCVFEENGVDGGAVVVRI
jgi:hypothetical protein